MYTFDQYFGSKSQTTNQTIIFFIN